MQIGHCHLKWHYNRVQVGILNQKKKVKKVKVGHPKGVGQILPASQ